MNRLQIIVVAKNADVDDLVGITITFVLMSSNVHSFQSSSSMLLVLRRYFYLLIQSEQTANYSSW